jgi:ZIP family zinc transporter
MSELLQVIALAAMPAFGNFMGGVLAEIFTISNRTLSLALHAAAGIVLAVVGVEIMPEALQARPPWVIVVAFMLGGVFFLLLDHLIGLIRIRFGRDGNVDTEDGGGPWVIYAGVAVDLFSDGIMIGVSSTIDLGLALLLALGQVSADIPEGFAIIATLKRNGIPRSKRILLSVAFTIPVLVGAILGYYFVRSQPEVIKLALLTFTAGILTAVVVEEIVPEAHSDGEARFAALVLVGGFALFTLLSIYLG